MKIKKITVLYKINIRIENKKKGKICKYMIQGVVGVMIFYII